MKDILIKARRAIRFLFYKDVSIENQILVSDTLDDIELEILFWKLNKADRHHSIEVLHRTMKHTDNLDILKLALLHTSVNLFLNILGLLESSQTWVY